MPKNAIFQNVFFDSDPIGLAEAFSPIPESVQIIIETDMPAETDATIYLGLPTIAGDIMEVKARVISSDAKGDIYSILLEILGVDTAFLSVAVSSLRAGEEKGSADREPVWAIGVRQTNNTYAMLVNSPAGLLTSAQLQKLAELSAGGSGIVKLTHAQRVLLFMPFEKSEEVCRELASVGLRVGVLHKGVRNIRACCGSLCKHSQGADAVGTALAIDKALYGRGAKFDVKLAISDCSRNCSESYCCDIGLIGENGKYKILVGGRGSHVPFRAIQLANGVAADQMPGVISMLLDWYEKNAKENERFWKLLVRLGESDAKEFDLSSIEKAMASFGDGIDETIRFREQLARLAAVKKLSGEINFSNIGEVK